MKPQAYGCLVSPNKSPCLFLPKPHECLRYLSYCLRLFGSRYFFCVISAALMHSFQQVSAALQSILLWEGFAIWLLKLRHQSFHLRQEKFTFFVCYVGCSSFCFGGDSSFQRIDITMGTLMVGPSRWEIFMVCTPFGLGLQQR